jgi:hypothetical protein
VILSGSKGDFILAKPFRLIFEPFSCSNNIFIYRNKPVSMLLHSYFSSRVKAYLNSHACPGFFLEA